MGYYSDVLTKNQYNLKDAAQKSQAWFTQQSYLLSRQKIQPQKMINTNVGNNSSRIVPGSMYLFGYDPLHKDTLPYWDAYPLVFPFRKLSDGFIGLNMHYMPYLLRVRLLDRLMVHANNKSMTDDTRLKLSWQTIVGSSRLNIAVPCVHRYLSTHVRTSFKKIDPSDWATAVLLPIHQFVGSTSQQVWKESISKV